MKEEVISQITKLVTEKLLAWFISKIGWLSVGPIKLLAGFFISLVIKKALELTVLGAILGYITIDTKLDLKAVNDVLEDRKKLKEENGSLTEDETKEFDDKLAENGIDLIRYGTIG